MPSSDAELCVCVSLPVQVILDVLREIHVEQDEVVEMAAAERGSERRNGGFTAPVPRPTHGVVRDRRRHLHVQQHTLQRYVTHLH